MDVSVEEIAGCTCLRMRRAARRVTQVYDQQLARARLTGNQFGLLGHLYGTSLREPSGLSIGALAERVGMDPTTLNRNLKPLQRQGLVDAAPDPADGRARLVRITEAGRRRLEKAVPLWRQAQGRVEAALGVKSMVKLNDLLDLSFARLGNQR